jgi:hypothetical protein
MFPTCANTLDDVSDDLADCVSFANNLLRVDRTLQLCKIRIWVHGAQEDGFELVHPCVREE